MSTKQQRDIEANLAADLSRIGSGPSRTAPTLGERRKRATDTFILPIGWVQPDPDQVRKQGKGADDPAVQELAESIREHGQMQAIEVRELKRDELYQIVAGEGRFVAMSQILGATEIKATLVDADEETIVWRQLHENIHRRSLHPLDLADSIEEAMQSGLKLAEVAEKLGKSEPWVQKARTVGRDLTDEARAELLKSEKGATVDTAYEVATVEADQQAGIAREIVEGGLNRNAVRDLTRKAKKSASSHRSGKTGRKSASKPFEHRYKDDATGLTFVITSRKRNVADADLLQAAESLVASLQPAKPAKAA